MIIEYHEDGNIVIKSGKDVVTGRSELMTKIAGLLYETGQNHRIRHNRICHKMIVMEHILDEIDTKNPKCRSLLPLFALAPVDELTEEDVVGFQKEAGWSKGEDVFTVKPSESNIVTAEVVEEYDEDDADEEDDDDTLLEYEEDRDYFNEEFEVGDYIEFKWQDKIKTGIIAEIVTEDGETLYHVEVESADSYFSVMVDQMSVIGKVDDDSKWDINYDIGDTLEFRWGDGTQTGTLVDITEDLNEETVYHVKFTSDDSTITLSLRIEAIIGLEEEEDEEDDDLEDDDDDDFDIEIVYERPKRKYGPDDIFYDDYML